MGAIEAWARSSTTGQGGAMLAAAAAAALHGAPLSTTLPMAVAGIVLLIFPQKVALSAAAQTVASDVVAAVPPILTDIQAAMRVYQQGHADGVKTATAVMSQAPALAAAASAGAAAATAGSTATTITGVKT